MANMNKGRKPLKRKSNRIPEKEFEKKASRDASKRNFQDAAVDRIKAAMLEKCEKFPMHKVHNSNYDNDASWYYKDAQILKDVASYSYDTALGNRINTQKQFAPNTQSQAASSIPGLMSIVVAPTPGVAIDAQSPINLGAQNIYTYIRKNNSGGVNYDAPDLMLYFIAMDSLYMAWNWAKRVYGYASTYSSRNRYQPRAFAAADNVNLDDIYSNLADFRGYLNMAADRISAFAVPSVFTYMVRHSWLFSNIYTDSSTRKAQNYMYVPAYFYLYDETSSPRGGILTPINVGYTKPTNAYKFSDIKSTIDQMINALQYAEDASIMSGDVIKAFGDSNLFKLSHFDADFKVEPVYSKEVLTQIENCTFFGERSLLTTANLKQFNITQEPNTNFLQFAPSFVTSGQQASYSARTINFHWDNPSPEEMMVASRLNVVTEAVTGKTTIVSCGSELALFVDVYVFSQGTTVMAAGTGALKLNSYPISTIGLDSDSPLTDTAKALLTLWLIASFDWCPELHVFIGRPAPNAARYALPPVKDWDNYTWIDADDIKAMNELALLTEFNVPN